MATQPPVFNVSYVLTQPFAGAANVVTNVVANPIPGVTPPPQTRTNYVVPATPPQTGIKVVGAVQMNITISDGTSNVLYPLGLAVQNPSVRSRPNPAVFPLATVSAATPTLISLDDTASADPTGTSYEFVILFQDKNGYFGTLDPRIVNDGDG